MLMEIVRYKYESVRDPLMRKRN